MATQQIAWGIDASNDLVLIHPNYQTPPYTIPDWNLVDITVSMKESVLTLGLNQQDSVLFYTKKEFPFEWESASLKLEEGKQAVKLDANPENETYVVINDGSLIKVTLPAEPGAEPKTEKVAGVEGVLQVSAAPDGLVWVVCGVKELGSVVKYMDAKGKWNTIPEMNNAMKVTGSPSGKAYVIDSSGAIMHVDKKGSKKVLSFPHGASQITVGPDDRVWVASNLPSSEIGGVVVFYSDDKGESWTEVKGSGALQLDAGVIDSDF